LSKAFHRLTDDVGCLRHAGNLRYENSKLTIAFDSCSKFRVLLLKLLDTRRDLAELDQECRTSEDLGF